MLTESRWAVILGRAGVVGVFFEHLEELEEVGSSQELLSRATSCVATPVLVVGAVKDSEGEIFNIRTCLLFVGDHINVTLSPNRFQRSHQFQKVISALLVSRLEVDSLLDSVVETPVAHRWIFYFELLRALEEGR